jgi:hypothetical protein
MAEQTILTFNVTNWITVTLMALIGFALLAVIVKIINRKTGTASTGGDDNA